MKSILVLFLSLFAIAATGLAQETILHNFNGTSDGAQPLGSLAGLGMTSSGGSAGGGTVFSINPNGSGFTVLHNFGSSQGDGAGPYGELTSFGDGGSNVYWAGTTAQGGSSNLGVAFRMNPDGSGYTLLHNFTGGTSDGASPEGDLRFSGIAPSGQFVFTLYGTTTVGGSSNMGAAFAMNIDGSGYQLVHSFTGGPSDGSNPVGSLLSFGGNYFDGMTAQGGSSNVGTIFRMQPSGSSTLLHSFTGGVNDGAAPVGSLLYRDAGEFAMTSLGGVTNQGVVFTLGGINGITILHSFSGGPNDGLDPEGSLVAWGTHLYGITESGGAYNEGTIFTVNSDATGFTILHSFTGGPSDGAHPYGGLEFDGSGILYGMTSAGGTANQGTIFSVVAPEPGMTFLFFVSLTILSLRRWRIAVSSSSYSSGSQTWNGLLKLADRRI